MSQDNFKIEYIITQKDKEKWWGTGEWCIEPDLVKFTFKGYDCKIIRVFAVDGPEESPIMFGGHLCGYVKIPNNHVTYCKHYDDINVDVHGGLTYRKMENEKDYWIGFDCAHSRDIIPSIAHFCKTDLHMIEKMPPIPEGFEKHPLFNPIYRNLEFCINECKSMVDQLIELQYKKDEDGKEKSLENGTI